MTEDRRPPRFPGYDVLARRDTPSWNAATRTAIERRLATPREPRFFSMAERDVADALCRRIVPDLPPEAVPLVALLDAKLFEDHGGGFRKEGMPFMREAWRVALAALDAEARARHGGRGFSALAADEQDALLQAMQEGRLGPGPAWQGMDPQLFFKRHVLVDVPPLYYGQPAAWNEMGFGGPASPRGYVRLDGDRPDPWEAAEAEPGREAHAERINRRVV